MYGVFFATSFLDLYRSPRQVSTSSLSLTVTVDSDEQYLFLVRAVSPFLGPPSDYSVVKMIPDERLPPRNLHRVRVDKTQATLKWQPPYDSPNSTLVRSGLVLALISIRRECEDNKQTLCFSNYRDIISQVYLEEFHQ
ncbi:sortilin-related receptor-like [Plectropomus leopardus]|uniref:sortilin-related receptor-like n=1 Tax=Plectropomus leopardus TaxID=160734 RepID=UPI001C4AA878|nr:sortilin-related receptor-like [Plectropomus leopardus]